jgi:hypothetical protein
LTTPHTTRFSFLAVFPFINMKSSIIKSTTKAWESLRPLLPSRGSDCDYWWNYTGLHLAHLLEAAGYSMDRQYQALLFHHHRVVSHALGSMPILRC